MRHKTTFIHSIMSYNGTCQVDLLTLLTEENRKSWTQNAQIHSSRSLNVVGLNIMEKGKKKKKKINK